MWLCDLEKALGKVIDFLSADACMVCIDKITPAADGGIVFMLSDRSRVKWFPDGAVVRREESEWRKPPADTPTSRIQSHGPIGGQMVRRMIEAYEGRMNNG